MKIGQPRKANLAEALKMKLIICFRHLKCICRKWCRGMDYSWHVQHLLREFGCGPLADLRSVSEWQETSREATVSVRVTSDLPAVNLQRVQEEASAVFGVAYRSDRCAKPLSQAATGGCRKAEMDASERRRAGPESELGGSAA
jgi:hypothetical protein